MKNSNNHLIAEEISSVLTGIIEGLMKSDETLRQYGIRAMFAHTPVQLTVQKNGEASVQVGVNFHSLSELSNVKIRA